MFKKTDITKSGLASKLTRLSNKHKGGLNQKKGSEYEEYFTLYKIVKNAAEIYRGNLTDAEIQDQVKLCFLDDLVIKKSNKKIDFYQIKNTKTLNWHKDLVADFEDQKRVNLSKKLNFSLVLVVSNYSLFTKLCNMPSSASSHTFVKYFAEPKNCEDLVKNNPDFHTWIKEISAKKDPTQMDLDSLAKILQSEWKNRRDKKSGSVKKLLKISNKASTPIRTKWVNTAKWKKAKPILDKINDFKFYTDRGIFEYEVKMNKGSDKAFIPAKPDSREFNRFLDKVITKKPKTIHDFEELRK